MVVNLITEQKEFCKDNLEFCKDNLEVKRIIEVNRISLKWNKQLDYDDSIYSGSSAYYAYVIA